MRWLAILLVAATPALATDMEMPVHGMDVPQYFGMAKAQLDGTGSRGQGQFNWDAEGWYGGDVDRVWLTSEGKLRGQELDEGEARLLWSRNISEFWDVQGGVRQDFAPAGNTSFAFGFAGLAPGFFETQAHVFVSARGEVFAQARQSIDLPITQALFLEPHAEVKLAVQDMPRQRMGAGFSNVALGLQLRYEIVRKFAPYVDLVWEKGLGNSIDFDRRAGEPHDELTLRGGIRFWF